MLQPEANAGGVAAHEAAFGAEHAEHLDAQRLDNALRALLETFPEAPVGALSQAGVYVPMPASVPLRRNPVIEGRTGLDNLSDADRQRLVLNWDRILGQGVGRCVIHPPNYPPTLLWGLDLRERHGVVLVLLTAAEGVDPGAVVVEPAPPGPPRFAALRKDELAQILEIDAATSEILGWSRQEMEGRRSLDFVHPDDHRLAVDNWMQMLANPGPARRVRQRLMRRDGSWCWFEVTNHNLLEDPAQGCVVAEMVDISDEMAAHEALREREQLLHRLAETLPVGVMQIDAERNVVYTNERLHEILGTPPAAGAEEQLRSVAGPHREVVREALARVLGAGSDCEIEVQLAPGAGHQLRTCTIGLRALTHEDGAVSGAIACVADVTESTRMRDELSRRATVDELTGCDNRAAIMRALDEHLASGQRRAERAVLFIDLDSFKEVNDVHGHAAGDELLRETARRLRAAVREQDRVGRIGGDEFLVLCPDVGGAQAAVRLAERVAGALCNDLYSAGGSRASIGVAWAEGEELSADALVAGADRAMYESKRARSGLPVLDAATMRRAA